MSQALALGNNYISGIGGIGKCKLVFPSSKAEGGARYDRAAKTIHVKEYWFKWDAIIHEYGHHVACEKRIDASTGGSYKPSENLIEKNDKGTAIRLSWSEAWAEAFSYLVFKSDYSDVWPDDYDAGYPVQAEPKFSETHILAITNILVSLSSELWQSDFLKLVLESGATTLSSFVAKCYNDSRVNFTNLCKELEDNFISPQNLTTVINAGIPTYKWSGGEYPNNKFDLVFFSHGAEFYRITDIYSTEYTVTSGQWNYISTIGSNITCAVAGYHAGSPLTGGYISKSVPLPVSVHTHSYAYQLYSFSQHKVVCPCGDYYLANHNFVNMGAWFQCVCGYRTYMIIEPDSEYIVDSIGYHYIVDSLFNLGGLQYVMSNARRGEACV